MTSPPSPPNRRWRRIVVIAIAVLSVVAMCSWWNWPRGDARFVGKWKLTIQSTGRADSYWVLRQNGNGYGEGANPLMDFGWRVEKGTLVLGAYTNPFGIRVRDWIKQLSGINSVNREERFPIQSIENEAIVLGPLNQFGEAITLTRIPE